MIKLLHAKTGAFVYGVVVEKKYTAPQNFRVLFRDDPEWREITGEEHERILEFL